MKKKVILMVCAWLLCIGHTFADELIISNVTIPQGGTMQLPVGFTFTTTSDKVGFTFSMTLPEGISFVKDEDGEPVYVKDAASINKLNIICAGEGNFAGQPANETATIKGTTGTLLTLTLKANATLAKGIYTVNVKNVTFQERVEGSVQDITLDDFSFAVTIGEPADTRTVLDELSTTVPEAATGVNVRVKRTINAGEWSTLCLPFAMTAEQVVTAFGEDVQLGDFTGCDVDDETGDVTAKFVDVTAIEANHPYVIKVGTAITEFTVDGVDIDADDAEVKCDKQGRRYNSFIGNYENGLTLEDGLLFLAGNQFWFSTGETKMKAFRAYFDFAAADAYYESRIVMSFGEQTTGINDAMRQKGNGTENIYNLSGQRVQKPGRGIYIYNGKKVIK